MATIPTVPTFGGDQVASIASLNELSYAVSFLCNNDVRPGWSVFMYNGTQAISASTLTSMAIDHTAYSTDASRSGSSVIINTQGYYDMSASVVIQADATDTVMYTACFQLTGGPSNPNLASGANLWHGYKSGRSSSTAEAPGDNAICITDIAPICLYPGDSVAVQVFTSATRTLNVDSTTTQTAYNIGRFAAKFTGHLIRLGP